MEASKIMKTVCDVLVQIQASHNLTCPALSDSTRPLHDLVSFDSPTSWAATAKVGRALGIKIPAGTNIFGDKSGLYTLGKTVAVIGKLAAIEAAGEATKV